MTIVARDEVRVAHAKKVFAFDRGCNLLVLDLDPFDVALAHIAGLALHIEEVHVDVLAVLDSRDHQLAGVGRC